VRPRLVAALAASALVAAAWPSIAPGGTEPASAPGAVSVSAREFALTLSRPSVSAGHVRVQLINRGEDDHDLRVSRVGGTRSWQYPVTGAGEAATRTLRLGPGRYRMICALEGHEALGMRATLRVRRAAR
jgi:plastocyanin